MTENRKNTLFWLGAATILLLALALRIAAAQGDLSQDEITSLQSLARIDRIDKIFWAINFDNNHPVNSVWLYLVGPNASFMAMRALSIACGTATVALAGVWGRVYGRRTALIAMALFATSYLMVNYGSVARGYAGMILCILLALRAVEDTLAGTDRRLHLGLIALIGTLFHFDMAMALTAMGFTCFWIIRQKTGDWRQAFDETLGIFGLSALAILPVILPPVLMGPYIIGHVEPFSLPGLWGGDNLALQSAANFPYLDFHDSDVGLAIIVALGWLYYHRTNFQAVFFAVVIIILPCGLWLCHVPNTNEPRHFLLCGTTYIMLIAAATGSARRWPEKLTAVFVIISMLVGNGILLQKFMIARRGHYSEAVSVMAAKDGANTYSIDQPYLSKMVDFYSQRQLVSPPIFVATADWCKGAPHYVILTHIASGSEPPAHIMQGPAECQSSYEFRHDYPTWGLIGSHWLLYERTP